jgi:hypothetical protein
MKKYIFLISLLSAVIATQAQVRTVKLTVYPEFKPSLIHLTDGRVLRQPLTNVFLKNATLMYMKGNDVMQANMSNILSVEFDDRTYVKIDTLLCYQVDSIGNDALFKATIIDVKAYNTQLRNNNVISNLSLGDQISMATIDLSTDEDFKFPLIDIYFYRYKGKFVRTHERNLGRLLSKEKRRMLRTYVTMDGFSWTDEKSLIKLLKSLQ